MDEWWRSKVGALSSCFYSKVNGNEMFSLSETDAASAVMDHCSAVCRGCFFFLFFLRHIRSRKQSLYLVVFLIYIPVLEPLVECLNIALNRRKDTNTDTSTLTFNDRPTTHSDTTVLLRSSHFLVFFFLYPLILPSFVPPSPPHICISFTGPYTTCQFHESVCLILLLRLWILPTHSLFRLPGHQLPQSTSKFCPRTTRALPVSRSNGTAWRSVKPWGLELRCSTYR